MYERHFSLTGLPFRLHPDLSFFYDAGQHRQILQEMNLAFERPKPFLVLSGELGCGKTTLLQRWAHACAGQGVRVAHLVNTQLDAVELQDCVCQGFGVAGPGVEPGEPFEAWRRVCTELGNGRAVLLVDEAQNLDASGFRVLVDLAMEARNACASLRICLAGQPELRDRVATADLSDLRDNVQAAWHLGRLSPGQTRDYVLYRLTQVGWTGRPSFDLAAFAEIQRATQGVPRRINVLCNRLLLTQFLNRGATVDGPSTAAAQSALALEIDGGLSDGLAATLPRMAPPPTDALMLVVAGRSDHIKAMSLLAALRRLPDSPAAVVVSMRDAHAWSINQDLLGGSAAEQITLAPGADEADGTDEALASGRMELAFARLLGQRRPSALVLFDGNALTRMCAVVGRAQRLPLVHVSAATGRADPAPSRAGERAEIGALADLRFDSGGQADPGAPPPGRAACAAGNLLIDAVRVAVEAVPGDADVAAQPELFAESTMGAHGYGVVVVRRDSVLPERELEELLRSVSRDLPLVWTMRLSGPLAQVHRAIGARLGGFRVICIDECDHRQFIRLLIGATCVLTDSGDVMEEAVALRVPCLALGYSATGSGHAEGWMRTRPIGLCSTHATRAIWELLFCGAPELPLPPHWDGYAGGRIARVLLQWLQDRRNLSPRLDVLARATPLG